MSDEVVRVLEAAPNLELVRLFFPEEPELLGTEAVAVIVEEDAAAAAAATDDDAEAPEDPAWTDTEDSPPAAAPDEDWRRVL